MSQSLVQNATTGGAVGRPESTYRVQFHRGFTFRQAAALTEYFAALGITHVYASPYFEAVAGSTHGYDVINHNRINPELGTREDYDAWTDALARAGLSHILDIVPNHVGVATNHNAWWNDVLRYGPASPYGRYFDITWEGSPRPELRNKLLLPVLGAPYGEALEGGQLQLGWEDGEVVVRYYERFFPVDPGSLGPVLERAAAAAPEELAQELRGGLIKLTGSLPEACASDEAACQVRRQAGETVRARVKALHAESGGFRQGLEAAFAAFNERPAGVDALDALLNAQAYRLAYWRVASDEINYRRFFDINDLAALSMERPDVFEATHRLLFELIRTGRVAGVRVDHPDGLYDPVNYFRRLREAVPCLYVVVEKILGAEESLPAHWPVDGTSGYDFLVRVNSLFVDPAGEGRMDQVYADFVGEWRDYEELVYRNKRTTLETALASELQMLAHEADRLAQRDRHSRDFTLRTLRDALREIIACFPVYRSYVADDGPGPLDREHLDRAVDDAARRNPGMSTAALAFLRTMVLQEAPGTFTDDDRRRQRRFAGKFQQLTAPATAKGIEDTTFYQYHRLISLCEVGGEPALFGSRPDALHAYFTERAAQWPYALSALSTHDTKRSEDVRARLNVLSEVPREWGRQVSKWWELTRPLWPSGAPAPDANDAYLLFQSVLGAWPPGAGEADADFVRRLQAYMTKALREAKVHTRWTDPNQAYEAAVTAWVGAVLGSRAFLREFLPFQQRVARWGMANSLAQTLLRLAAPGVPDLYQGTELWDFSLVDPDNRRPVDYAAREAALHAIRGRAEGDRENMLREFIGHAEDGRVKLFLNWVMLSLRRQFPGLFSRGEYLPLPTTGKHATRVFAFARRHEGQVAVVIVPRLIAGLGEAWPVAKVWGDTAVALPDDTGSWRDVFSSRSVSSGRIEDVFAIAPFAVLVR